MSKTVKIVLVVVVLALAIYIYYRWKSKKNASKNVITSPTAAVNAAKPQSLGRPGVVSEGTAVV